MSVNVQYTHVTALSTFFIFLFAFIAAYVPPFQIDQYTAVFTETDMCFGKSSAPVFCLQCLSTSIELPQQGPRCVFGLSTDFQCCQKSRCQVKEGLARTIGWK